MKPALKILLLTVLAAVAVSAAVTLYRFNPETAGIYPPCPSKLLTDYECAGCGSLRGIHSLLHGNFGAAWNYNPAIFFALALLSVIGIAGIHRRRFAAKVAPKWLLRLSRRTARVTDHYIFPLAVLAGIIIWTIIRNI